MSKAMYHCTGCGYRAMIETPVNMKRLANTVEVNQCDKCEKWSNQKKTEKHRKIKVVAHDELQTSLLENC